MYLIKLNKFLLISLILIIYYCQAAQITTWQRYSGFSDKKCIDRETNREYYIGEAFYRPGKCIRVQCLGNLQLWEDGCSVPKLDGNCTEISGDLNLQYPKCCPKYSCRIVSDYGNIEETKVYNHYGTLLSNSITKLFVISQT